MKKKTLVMIALLGLIPFPTMAQTTPTVKVPLCLQYSNSKTYVPCTGVVPVDPVTGTPFDWHDLKSTASTPDSDAGVPSSKAKAVQNSDGSKLASETQLLVAVNRLTELVGKLTNLISVMGVPAQAPAPATSVAATGSVTTFAVTASSGSSPSFTSGTANIKFIPQIALPIRVSLGNNANFKASFGTSTDGCVSVTPLTVAGQTWGSYTTDVDEFVDTPSTTSVLAGIVYCLKVTVTSGTLTYAVRQ